MTKRDRMVIVVVLALAAVVGSWMLVIQPKRDQASKLGAQISSAQSDLAAAQAQVAAGQAAKRSYAAYYTELARLGEAVPGDDNTPSLIYQLQGAANKTHVDFNNLILTPGASSAAAPAAPAAAATGASAAAPAGATGASAPLPPGAGVNSGGLPVQPFTLTFNGNFFHLADFLGRIERFVTATPDQITVHGRLMTLNAINIGPGATGFPSIAVTINATTYLAPTSQGALGGGTPAGPATASSSGGSSPSSSTSAPPTAAATSPTP